MPTLDQESLTAAVMLFNYVMCDIAGTPMVLGSDRGKAFVESVVRCLAERFGIAQVLGSAYNPQAQSTVERPHRTYNMMCKTFMNSTRDWDLVAPIFQWTVRTTAKIYNGHYSPYEIITGMKPRSPLDFLASGNAIQPITHDEYVEKLVKYLKHVHELVDEQHRLVRDDEQNAKYRSLGPGNSLKVGDHCFVRSAPLYDVSRRLQHKNRDTVYVIVEVHGDGDNAKAYTLADLTGRRHNLGFSQPVVANRLTPINLLPMTHPDGESRTRILISDHGRDRHGTITGQTMDGQVVIRYDDDAESQDYLDLTKVKYQWL
jgi:hypothetical protein